MASTKHRGAGFSLVEVLVSIVVLSVGLLGAMHMLLASVRASNEAATFTAALNLVRELSEKARMNTGAPANAYLVESWTEADAGTAAVGPGCAAAGVACSPAQLAAWDMQEWKRSVASALPDARLSICVDDALWNEAADAYAWACSHAGHNVVVKLGWMPRNAVSKTPALQSAPRLVMQLVPMRARNGHADS
jgi:type IV pilus assembly protein PilV